MGLSLSNMLEVEANLLKSLRQSGNVTIGLVPFKPYVMDCFGQSNCSRPGLGVELAREVCSILNISCQLIKETDTKWGDNITSGNGEWQGMIRYVMDQKYNTAMPSFNPTATRMDVVDFSRSIYDDTTSVVTRFPTAKPVSLTSLILFKTEIMALIIGTFFVIGFLTVFFDISKYEVHKHSFKCIFLCRFKHWLNVLIDAIDTAAVLYQQGPSEKRTHGWGYYVVFGVWSLCCVVLIGTYSSYVLAAAVTIDQDLPFWNIETLSTCIKEGGCKMIAKTTSVSHYERIFSAEEGQGVFLLKKALEVHPVEQIPTGMDKAEMILHEKQDYNVIILSSGQYSQMVQQHETCSFDHAKIHAMDPLTFPFHKGSKLRALFNLAIVALHDVGIIQKITNKYVGEHTNNDHCRASKVGSQPMGLTTFFYVFLTLFVGIILGSAVLVLEKFIAIRNGEKKWAHVALHERVRRARAKAKAHKHQVSYQLSYLKSVAK